MLATRWVAVLALLLWIVLPLVVGYRRFQRADL
ncbi:MAG: ABC transporter permease subunit [Halovenus sp.]